MHAYDDLEIILAELAHLDAAGLNAEEGIAALRERIRRRPLRQALDELEENCRCGLTLGQAMARVGGIFHPVIRGLVVAGEKSGDLAGALVKSASFLAMRRSVLSALRTAGLYPFAVLTVGAIVSVLLAFFILPHQWALVEKMHLQIWRTDHTQSPHSAFVAASIAIRASALLICALWLAAVVLALLMLKAPHQPLLHRVIARLPGFGPVVRRYFLFHFASVLEMQLSRGVPLTQALDALADDASLPLVAEAARCARNSLELGAPMSNGLVRTPIVFPPQELWFLRHAERYEHVPRYFAELANKTAAEIRTIERLILRFEPLAIGLLSIVVAMFLVSVFLPISRWYQFISLGE